MDTQTQLLTLEDAAKALKLAPNTVRKLIKEEGLPVIRFGRAVRIDQGKLQEWLDSRHKKQGR